MAIAAPVPGTGPAHRAARVRDAGRPYERRRPEETVLHAVVSSSLETFLERRAARFRAGRPEVTERRGCMRILAAIHSAAAIRAILKCLGLPPSG